jgi:uncharacterized repeat protein (TIGR03803 family)
MTGHQGRIYSNFAINLPMRTIPFVLAAILAAAIMSVPAAHAQTYQALYNFPLDTGAGGSGLVIDPAGNLYGVIGEGLFGSLFKFSHSGSGWMFSIIYRFQGSPDAASPVGLSIAPDGSLYGETFYGGTGPCEQGSGCGTVFRVRPPVTFCRTARCYWDESVLYSFQGYPQDLQHPFASNVAFDQAGNLYGTATEGGTSDDGGVYRLTRTQSGWTYGILHSFSGGADGAEPWTGVTLDAAGNLYGTTMEGGQKGSNCNNGCGTVYEISPSGSGWNESVLYSFSYPGASGCCPYAPLTLDQTGNLYGTTQSGGSTGGGTVYELSPSNGGFGFSLVYTFPSQNGDGDGSESKLVMDQAGNFYGATEDGGLYGLGMVFKLTPGSGGWTFTVLHEFDGNEGSLPAGNLVLDASGNLYGVAVAGGKYNDGVIWEITP